MSVFQYTVKINVSVIKYITEARQFLLWLLLGYPYHRENDWCASVGIHNGNPSVHTNDWTDRHHYVCQYDSE